MEFEILEGAYEISCPDAQCLAQGVITLPEIANLTTNNLLKKHHRYRLNRGIAICLKSHLFSNEILLIFKCCLEIELDKTRMWCPKAGCETVCVIGVPKSQTSTSTLDAIPSTSSSSMQRNPLQTATTTVQQTSAHSSKPSPRTPVMCAVLCPSCKEEFCSICKKSVRFP